METHNEAEVLLTQTEAAAILKKSISWMERARWNGSGPPYRKLGRAVRYPLSTLHKWIVSHPLQSSTAEDSNEL
ncbi:MAG: helix-turn-helix domain-containing protein [Candidatus Marinimicrobia bacterium]|nr:helix-turn-helix domain-containing protein [Candidatus Neomarinimicrobiota bacterium]